VMKMEVSREEWVLWQEHPVTQALVAMLQRHHKELEEAHLDRFRQQVVLSDDWTKVKDAKALGAYEVYSYLLDMDEDDVNS
jgi:hypothetical protein